MSARTESRMARSEFLKATDAVKVIALCEDEQSDEAAMELCKRLGGRFNDLAFSVLSWRFCEMEDTATASEVLGAAEVADVILFSTHGNLPSAVREWIESCAGRWPAHEGALALLLSESLDCASSYLSLLSFFEYAALRLNMDFLLMLPDSQEAKQTHPRETVLTFDSSPSGVRPHGRWGLNE